MQSQEKPAEQEHRRQHFINSNLPLQHCSTLAPVTLHDAKLAWSIHARSASALTT